MTDTSQWLQSERFAALRATKEKQRRNRVRHIAKTLAERYERQRDNPILAEQQGLEKRQPFKYKAPSDRLKLKTLIAYDLETTSIKTGTPSPLYLTAFSDVFQFSGAILPKDGDNGLAHLAYYIQHRFLIPEHNAVRFVAWYGNKFDAYFIAAALLEHCPQYIIRPYMTRNHTLRGMKITDTTLPNTSWEFLDAHAMIMGGVAKTLKSFLETFAPEYGKLEAPDFDKADFDIKNKKHVAYAERDSEGLWYGVMRAQEILVDTFSVPLQPTIGKAGIRIFQEHMPRDVVVYDPPYSAINILKQFVMRGGYCHCVKPFRGMIWKYDINQAYSAAMRDSFMPCGRMYEIGAAKSKYAKCAIYLVHVSSSSNRVPFYITSMNGVKEMATESFYGWITSSELTQLESEKIWRIVIEKGMAWDDAFTMTDYVNKLEKLRTNATGGPKGAVGTMVKQIGNNSYGKTVEQLDGLELVMSKNCPENFYPFQAPDEFVQHLWFQFNKPEVRAYHKPQIGAFITAHVRMELRRAILLNVDAWLYSDTDCCAFSVPVDIPISKSKYGLWKVEAADTEYIFIGKKVYCAVDGSEKKAKGLNVSKLRIPDYERWLTGDVPVQSQVQRQNFVKTMTGGHMFADSIRSGSKILHSIV